MKGASMDGTGRSRIEEEARAPSGDGEGRRCPEFLMGTSLGSLSPAVVLV